MKKYCSMNFTVKAGSIIFLLILANGCAVQPKKTEVPVPLKSEIKSLEDQKSGATYRTQIQSQKATYYIVKKGDTLWRISKNYGVSVNAILGANHITNTKDLKVGQKLFIPVSGRSQTSSSFVSRSGYEPARDTAGDVSSRGFIWPVKGQIVSQFGEVRNGTKNSGIHILPHAGQKVVAAKKGTIEAVSDAGDGMSVIVIKHEQGIRTIYESCGSPVVGEGSYVERGHPIADINSTNGGKSQEITFKIYVKDKPVNPRNYLP